MNYPICRAVKTETEFSDPFTSEWVFVDGDNNKHGTVIMGISYGKPGVGLVVYKNNREIIRLGMDLDTMKRDGGLCLSFVRSHIQTHLGILWDEMAVV